MSEAPFDHVLIVGFGGATNLEEVEPFLKHVAEGGEVPEERINLMRLHYEAIGGRSPYNDYVKTLVQKLKEDLAGRGITVPVFLGMRHWRPFLDDALKEIRDRGLKRGLCLGLAAQRSALSLARYKQAIQDSKAASGAESVEHVYLQGWYDHPLYIEAQADEVRRAMKGLAPWNRWRAHLLFSSSSVPLDRVGDCPHCDYNGEFRVSSHLVAAALGQKKWSLSFQSMTGRASMPWVEPDVNTMLGNLAAEKKKVVVCVPIGFLFDTVEVLYDLDIAAKERARELKIKYVRASTVMAHSKFIVMLGQLIEQKIRG
ncbi:MAG TPA: ferrochelatase [Verrucomicrobiae bacterium]|jgi:ferrochelatase|nr:ferrochelatase [Verrucomicrobiae bacterium]